MITVNMHEAKSRLSELVKAVETQGETVVLCRDGVGVAEIRTLAPVKGGLRDLTPDPRLAAVFAPGYDPTETASEDEWPEEFR